METLKFFIDHILLIILAVAGKVQEFTALTPIYIQLTIKVVAVISVLSLIAGHITTIMAYKNPWGEYTDKDNNDISFKDKDENATLRKEYFFGPGKHQMRLIWRMSWEKISNTRFGVFTNIASRLGDVIPPNYFVFIVLLPFLLCLCTVALIEMIFRWFFGGMWICSLTAIHIIILITGFILLGLIGLLRNVFDKVTEMR